MRYFVLILSVLLCSGCSFLITPPQVRVQDVGVVGLDSKGVDIELALAVTNPNSFDLKLVGYSYDLKVMALPLAKGGRREAFEFPADSTTDLRLPVRVTLRDLYELLKRRPDPDGIPYRLDAGLEVSSLLGTHAVPVTKSGTFKVPERYRPSFYLRQLPELLPALR